MAIRATKETPIYLVIHEMIADMKKVCREQKKPTTWRNKFVYAVPYIEALGCCDKITDKYGFDDARSLITCLLCNLSTYKGENAKEFKKVLKQIANIK